MTIYKDDGGLREQSDQIIRPLFSLAARCFMLGSNTHTTFLLGLDLAANDSRHLRDGTRLAHVQPIRITGLRKLLGTTTKLQQQCFDNTKQLRRTHHTNSNAALEICNADGK